ncbi:MAG TPA: cold shock domain-containing protein [bacterium]|nr:cold shock domain-containing protein [bacterium]
MNSSAPVPAPRIIGTVTWYNKVTGFGFIRVEGMSDVFVNEAAIDVPGRRVLREGETVELEIVNRDGRREATHVVPVN